jgi:hypothetical protein
MNTSKIARYVWIGRKDFNWYRDCEEVFVELFGRDRLRLVCQLFAATSINTSLKANITLFRKALYEIDNGLPRGKYLPNIQAQIDSIRAGGELSGRKINSFARAMSGDPDAVVVDVWLLRAFDMDKKYFRKSPGLETNHVIIDEDNQEQIKYSINLGAIVDSKIKKRGLMRSGGASDSQYSKIETYVREEAKAMGIQPRQLSAMLWSGVRIDQSGDKETHYKTLLRDKLINLFNCI